MCKFESIHLDLSYFQKKAALGNVLGRIYCRKEKNKNKYNNLQLPNCYVRKYRVLRFSISF